MKRNNIRFERRMKNDISGSARPFATSLGKIISQFFLAFLLVHTYDLLQNRRTDEVINNFGGFFII